MYSIDIKWNKNKFKIWKNLEKNELTPQYVSTLYSHVTENMTKLIKYSILSCDWKHDKVNFRICKYSIQSCDWKYDKVITMICKHSVLFNPCDSET